MPSSATKPSCSASVTNNIDPRMKTTAMIVAGRVQAKDAEQLRHDAVQAMLRQLEGLLFWEERVLLFAMADYMEVFASLSCYHQYCVLTEAPAKHSSGPRLHDILQHAKAGVLTISRERALILSC
jgi:hypothetical protein